MDDKSTAQARVQMQIVSQLEIQLQKVSTSVRLRLGYRCRLYPRWKYSFRRSVQEFSLSPSTDADCIPARNTASEGQYKSTAKSPCTDADCIPATNTASEGQHKSTA